jgi:hypothetical protein
VRKLDLETYIKPYNERAGHHVLGLLAAADLSWAGAERGLLASRPEASPPPKNKFHGDGAPVRTQGLECGWLRLKRKKILAQTTF